jgi:hypothetical protein
MADFNRRRRWRGPALGGPLQRGARYCFAAFDGEATTAQSVRGAADVAHGVTIQNLIRASGCTSRGELFLARIHRIACHRVAPESFLTTFFAVSPTPSASKLLRLRRRPFSSAEASGRHPRRFRSSGSPVTAARTRLTAILPPEVAEAGRRKDRAPQRGAAFAPRRRSPAVPWSCSLPCRPGPPLARLSYRPIPA